MRLGRERDGEVRREEEITGEESREEEGENGEGRRSEEGRKCNG